MIEDDVVNDTAGWDRQYSVEYCQVRSFRLTEDGGRVHLELILGSKDGRQSLVAVFKGVVDLKIDWPNWGPPIVLDGLTIEDRRADGWEHVNFRVFEGAGVFAFSCHSFKSVTGPTLA